MNKQDILDILKDVSVPNIGQNVMALGWLKEVRIEENNIYLDMTIAVEKADI